jgi:hypothetical protein
MKNAALEQLSSTYVLITIHKYRYAVITLTTSVTHNKYGASTAKSVSKRTKL